MQRIRQSKTLLILALLAVLSWQAWALAQQIQVKNGNNWIEAQGDSNGFVMIGGVRNITLLASGTHTTLQQSATIPNANYRGVILYLNITAASGTGGLSPILVATDPVSGASSNVATIGSAKTATGLIVYTIYPVSGLTTASGGTLAFPLPANWSIKINVGDATSYTYSLSADLLF